MEHLLPLEERLSYYQTIVGCTQGACDGAMIGAAFGPAVMARLAPMVVSGVSKSIQLNRFHQAACELSGVGQNNIRVLRGWAKSKGWKKLTNPEGRPEIWGINTSEGFEFRLKIKAEASLRSGLDSGSGIPRFDARLNKKNYINPFTGEIGNSNVGTHIPLETKFYE